VREDLDEAVRASVPNIAELEQQVRRGQLTPSQAANLVMVPFSREPFPRRDDAIDCD
jgi:hypothetical protein